MCAKFLIVVNSRSTTCTAKFHASEKIVFYSKYIILKKQQQKGRKIKSTWCTFYNQIKGHHPVETSYLGAATPICFKFIICNIQITIQHFQGNYGCQRTIYRKYKITNSVFFKFDIIFGFSTLKLVKLLLFGYLTYTFFFIRTT